MVIEIIILGALAEFFTGYAIHQVFALIDNNRREDNE